MIMLSATRRSSGPEARSPVGWMEILAALEPTLHVEESGEAEFALSGRRIRLVLEPDGWLVARMPLDVAANLLPPVTGDIGALAKIVDGPALRVDVPLAASRPGALGEAFKLLRVSLRGAVDLLAGDGATPEDDATPDGGEFETTRAVHSAAEEVLRTYAASSPRLVSSDDHGFTLVVEAARGRQQRISARIVEGRICLTAPLGPEPRSPVSRRAVAHLLKAIGEHVRLVRGAVDSVGARLEVVLPTSHLDLDLIDKAMGALIAAAAMTKRECGLLLEPAVAEAFCDFHAVGTLPDERTAGTRTRASHPERSIS